VEPGRFPRPLLVPAAHAAGWLAFYAGWLALAPWGERGSTIFANTAYHVPIVAATVLAGWAFLRGVGGPRAFWALFALSNAIWLAGELLWSVRELDTGEVPYPWWTDACYLGSSTLLLAAVLAAFRPSLRTVQPSAILDGLIVSVSLGALWWWGILRPLDLGLDLASLVGLVAPVFGLVLLALLAITRLLPSRRSTKAMGLVAAGIACAAVADGLYTHAAITHSYLSGAWIELGWQAEALFFALAGAASVARVDRRSDWLRFRRPGNRLTGAIAGAAAVVLATILAVGLERGDAVLLLAGAPLGVALLARGVVALGGRGKPRSARAVDDGPYFADHLRRELLRAVHFGESFGVVLVEAPGATSTAVERIGGAVGELDVVARLDDGRIAVLLPRLEHAQAFGAAEQLRATVGSQASAGVAVWEQGESGESLVERAESLLAAACRLGGNHTRGPEADLLLGGSQWHDQARNRQLLELAAIVDARYGVDPLHSRRVAKLAEALAIKLDLDHASIRRASLGGLLHAVGTLTVSDEELHPGGPLAMLESDPATRHARHGAEIVRRLGGLGDVAVIVDCHQERCDGTGPKGLRDDEIPLEAGIVAVANALVTLTTDRPGAQQQSLTSALTELWRFTESRYDPEVVSALFRLVREDDHVLDDGTTFVVLV
jgi:hypothetical protein